MTYIQTNATHNCVVLTEAGRVRTARVQLQLYYLQQKDKLSSTQTVNGVSLTVHLWFGHSN